MPDCVVAAKHVNPTGGHLWLNDATIKPPKEARCNARQEWVGPALTDADYYIRLVGTEAFEDF
jgi:hypothetical protein